MSDPDNIDHKTPEAGWPFFLAHLRLGLDSRIADDAIGAWEAWGERVAPSANGEGLTYAGTLSVMWWTRAAGMDGPDVEAAISEAVSEGRS